MRWYVEPARVRPALVQRRLAPPDRRPPEPGRKARGRARRAPQRATMRISSPGRSIPFAWGGTEVMTDRLVDELRLRGHESSSSRFPSSGIRALAFSRRRSCGGCSTSRRWTGRGWTWSSRRSSPRTSCDTGEARLARPSVPAGVRARRNRPGAVRRVVRGSRAAPEGACARPRRARGGNQALLDLPERRRPARAHDSSRPSFSLRRRRSSSTAATATETSCSR